MQPLPFSQQAITALAIANGYTLYHDSYENSLLEDSSCADCLCVHGSKTGCLLCASYLISTEVAQKYCDGDPLARETCLITTNITLLAAWHYLDKTLFGERKTSKHKVQ